MPSLLSYRKLFCLGLFAATLPACSQEAPDYPDQALLLCESASDCPTDWECLACPEGTEGCEADQSICAPVFDNVCGTADAPGACCGNGTREAWEFCDDGAANTDAYGQGQRCTTTCDGYAPYCGDEIISDGESCDDGAANTDAYSAGKRCNTTCDGYAPYCGDDIVSDGETCDAGSANSDDYRLTAGCNTSCSGLSPHCGDGIVQREETCDDGAGNTDAYSASADQICNTDCDGYAPYCGDDIVSNDEVCDQGRANNDSYTFGGTCDTTCSGLGPHCGDGIEQSEFENCDDGSNNTNAYSVGEFCNMTCQGIAPRCGDGRLQADEGEACDDGHNNSDVYSGAEVVCNRACSGAAPRCGDGIKQAQEACDSGSANSNGYSLDAKCNASCTALAPYCGDGYIDGGEFCDDGSANSDAYSLTMHCNADCSGAAPFCGDGIRQGNEACDDGNTDNGDYCQDDCQASLTICGDGEVQGDEVCDDGARNSDAYAFVAHCNATCTGYAGYCGDGLVQQRGLVNGSTFGTGESTDGIDTGEWEGCDPGSSSVVSCSALHPALGGGDATCTQDCVTYDTTQCDNQTLAYVPAGPFMMGCNPQYDNDCDENQPYHEVYLDAYVIEKTEVSASDYIACIDRGDCTGADASSNSSISSCGSSSGFRNFDWRPIGGYHVESNRGNHPANCVHWDNATTYCASIGRRLPTEAEWEKSARGNDGRPFPWGVSVPTCEEMVFFGWHYDPSDDDANSDGWLAGNGCGKERTWEVDSQPDGRSMYGLYHMSGNVWEWVSDVYSDTYYLEAPYKNPRGPFGEGRRSLRGGSFISNPESARVYHRNHSSQLHRGFGNGFRCVESTIKASACAESTRFQDGQCDASNNVATCGWDGGDCCESTCWAEDGICGSRGYMCLDPDVDDDSEGSLVTAPAPDPSNCDNPGYHADGWCDAMNNVAECGWDGGDCCESTCVERDFSCGSAGYTCLDPTVN